MTDNPIRDTIITALQEANPGQLVTGYVLTASITDGGEETAFYYETLDNQPIHATFGLLKMVTSHFERNIGNADEDR